MWRQWFCITKDKRCKQKRSDINLDRDTFIARRTQSVHHRARRTQSVHLHHQANTDPQSVSNCWYVSHFSQNCDSGLSHPLRRQTTPPPLFPLRSFYPFPSPPLLDSSLLWKTRWSGQRRGLVHSLHLCPSPPLLCPPLPTERLGGPFYIRNCIGTNLMSDTHVYTVRVFPQLT